MAHCFEKNEQGFLEDRHDSHARTARQPGRAPHPATCRRVIEPISANSLECMSNQGATSFVVVTSMHLEEALSRDKSGLPDEFQEAVFCDEFANRLAATARTWKRDHAQNNLM